MFELSIHADLASIAATLDWIMVVVGIFILPVLIVLRPTSRREALNGTVFAYFFTLTTIATTVTLWDNQNALILAFKSVVILLSLIVFVRALLQLKRLGSADSPAEALTGQ